MNFIGDILLKIQVPPSLILERGPGGELWDVRMGNRINETNLGDNTMTSLHKKSFAAEQLKRQQQEKKTGLWILIAVVGVVVVIGGYVLYSRFGTKEEPAPATEEIKSIAVNQGVEQKSL